MTEHEETFWHRGSVSDIAVCIATFGDASRWGPMVKNHALPSVRRQTLVPRRCTWTHRTTLHDARNDAAKPRDVPGQIPDGRWLCFLDADDELDDGYIEAMTAAATDLDGDWLLQPATLGVYPDGHEDPRPVLIPPRPLLDGNFMIISTLIRAEQFRRLGGFDDLEMYEDWDLWIRAWLDGARFKAVPDAVVRVHVNSQGRNSGDRDTQLRVYHQIRNRYLRRP